MSIFDHIMVKAMRNEELDTMKRLTEEGRRKRYAYAVFTEAHAEEQSEQKNQKDGKSGDEEGDNEQDLSLWEQFPVDDTVFAFTKRINNLEFNNRSVRRFVGRTG